MIYFSVYMSYTMHVKGDNMYKLLIIEDEDEIRRIIVDNFPTKDFYIYEASNGVEGLAVFEANPEIDLIILDVMMPELDGWTVCRRIRKKSDIPIIMLTARGDEDDELMGFELKADDYVKKPFSPNVLLARVLKLIQNHHSENTSSLYIIKSGDLILHIESRFVTLNGEELQLTLKEFEILYYMMKNSNIVLSRDSILNGVWGIDYFGDDRVVDTHIKKLRKLLGEKAYYIKTIFGVGYKFEVKS